MLFVFLVLFITALSPHLSSAQDATETPTPPTPPPQLFSQYQSDYLYQLDLYQQTYKTYTTQKSQFSKYGSLTAEKDLSQAVSSAIAQRNLTLKTYLIALQAKLNGYSVSDPDTTAKIQSQLHEWENWLASSEISAVNFPKNYGLIQAVIYSALATDHLNRLKFVFSQFQTIRQTLADKSLNQADVSDLISRSVSKDTEITKYFEKAQSVSQTKQNTSQYKDFYPEAKKYLNLAQNALITSITDLKSLASKIP